MGRWRLMVPLSLILMLPVLSLVVLRPALSCRLVVGRAELLTYWLPRLPLLLLHLLLRRANQSETR